MEKKIHKTKAQPSGAKNPNIEQEQEINIKAAHLSSKPINDIPTNSHFEVEVQNAFFRVFNINTY